MNSTELEHDEKSPKQEPWQSWGTTARYLVIWLVQIAPWAWLTYVHR